MIIGDGVILGAGGETASILVTGLSKTDTVTASKDGKTVIGKWTQIPNPAYVVPAGYKQLEYIESTGSQYIDTGFFANQNTKITLDCDISYGSNWDMILGSYDSNASFSWWAKDSKIYAYYAASNLATTAPSGSTTLTADRNKWTANGATMTFSASTFTASSTVYLFSVSAGGNYTKASMRLYSSQFYDNGTISRDFVPVKRLSDNVIGLYDKVEQKFYANAGTGAFTAGAEVPQTIDGGFLIDKIKDYGIWTVTATDGTNTATRDVLVDTATQYNVGIEYTLWLYKYGDERKGVTGGWNPYSYRPSDVSYNGRKPSVTRKDTSILVSQDRVFENWGSFFAENLIDLTNYSTLNIHVIRSASRCDNSGWNGGSYMRIFVSGTKADHFTELRSAGITQTNTSTVVKTDFTVTCNISSITGKKYVAIWIAGMSSTGENNVEFDKIWLE